MNRRWRHLILLSISVVAFAGMVLLVSSGVVSRRRSRDLVFGLEQLDVLMGEGEFIEAGAMIPWLATRAREATQMLSILKRGVAVLDASGNATPLDEAARVATSLFPGNNTIRSIGVYAAVLTNDLERALEWSRLYLTEDDATIYAWVLLKSGEAQVESTVVGEGETREPFFLAGLKDDALPADFEHAWRFTGEWRYAADASILHLKNGDVAAALKVMTEAAVPLHAPLLAADVFRDAGDDQSALSSLRSASTAAESRILPRLSDALIATGQAEDARAIYLDMVDRLPGLSPVPFVNLAWMSDSDDQALAYYNAAVAGFPEHWMAIEQRALYLALSDLASAYDSLTDYRGPQGGTREALLRLKLEPQLDQRGYEATLWRLVVADDAPEEAIQFAAWYFLGRGQEDELSSLLERTTFRSSWIETYRGLLQARAGAWDDALESFSAAYMATPSWSTRHNVAISHLALGEEDAGLQAIADAVSLARRSGLPRESSPVFVALARASSDRIAAYDAVKTALELDPTNTEALLVRGRLESGTGY